MQTQPTRRASRDLIAATFVLVVTPFLPWAASGRIDRSGWELVGSARRLGVVDDTWGEILAVSFFVVPAVAFAMLIAHVLDRPRLVAGGGVFATVATVVVAGAVLRSPLGSQWGLWLNIGVALVDGVLLIRLLRVSGVGVIRRR